MFRRFAVLCAGLAVFSCGPGGEGRDAGQFPPLGGGTFGGSGGFGGGSGATGGGAGAFSCSELNARYVLVGTNDVPGLCEFGARVPFQLTPTGCSAPFTSTLGGVSLTGTCQFSSSGVCMTTVRINGTDTPVTLRLDAGAETGTGALGSGASTCTFSVEVEPTLGQKCECPTPATGTQLCQHLDTGCNKGEWCVQEDERDGAYCSQPPSACTDPRFEPARLNGIDLCAFGKKFGSCEHSAQCESCSSGTPGITSSAACFAGSCRVRCTSSSSSCNCVFATPVSGDAVGYCSDFTCR